MSISLQSDELDPAEVRVFSAQSSHLGSWQAFVDEMPHAGCMHHAGWYDVLQDAFSVEPHFLMATDATSRIVGILPLYTSNSRFTGAHVSSLEEGLLTSHPSVEAPLLEAALRLFRESGGKYLQIRGPLRDGGAATVIRNIHTVIPTSNSRDALWSAIKKKARWAIRQCAKEPLVVEDDPGLLHLEDFYRCYAEHMRSLGTPVTGFDAFDSIRSRLGLSRLRLYIVRYRSKIIGGMLCILNSGRWTDQYAIVRPEGTPFANYLLYWHAISAAADAKIPIFDLGRSTPDSNVHLFKRKWGGFDTEMPYHFFSDGPDGKALPRLEALKKDKKLAQRIWPHLPLPVCNLIGPMLRKKLPFI